MYNEVYSGTVSTKRELVEIALKEYVENRKRKNIGELKGKIKFSENYDYKAMRKCNTKRFVSVSQ